MTSFRDIEILITRRQRIPGNNELGEGKSLMEFIIHGKGRNEQEIIKNNTNEIILSAIINKNCV
jgi:hypothetical protein